MQVKGKSVVSIRTECWAVLDDGSEEMIAMESAGLDSWLRKQQAKQDAIGQVLRRSDALGRVKRPVIMQDN